MSNQDLKLKSKPWITNVILKEIKIRDKIYTKHKKAASIIRKEDLEFQMRIQKNKVKTLLQNSKRLYFTKYFSDNSTNVKKLWEGVNEIISSSKRKSPNSINCLEINDTNGNKINITNPKEIANNANKYFTNIAGDILKKEDTRVTNILNIT